MQIDFRSRGIDATGEIREYASRRIGFALGRFADRIVRITITLADINGPRGGTDKSCRISIRPLRMDQFHVTAETDRIHESIDLAAERAKRALSRRLDRFRSRQAGGASKLSREF